jgi:hypothetical protein
MMLLSKKVAKLASDWLSAWMMDSKVEDVELGVEGQWEEDLKMFRSWEESWSNVTGMQLGVGG